MIERNTGIVAADAASAANHLRNHLRYLHYGARCGHGAGAERQVFSATADQVQFGEVLSALIDSAPQVVWQKLFLAPEGEMVCDWRAWTRQQMQQKPDVQGWVGLLHLHADLPHVHVVFVVAQTPLATITDLATHRAHRPCQPNLPAWAGGRPGRPGAQEQEQFL